MSQRDNFDRVRLRKQIKKQDILKILRLFFSNPPEVLSFKVNNKGLNNLIYVVETDISKYVIHVLNPSTNIGQVRDIEDLGYVSAFQDAVARAGVPVPQRFLSREGLAYADYTIDGADFFITLHDFVEGHGFLKLNPAQLCELGTAVAQIHQVAQSLTLDAPPTRTWSIGSYLEQNVLAQPVDMTTASQLPQLQPYLNELYSLMQQARNYVSEKVSNLKKYPIHGDINGNNLLFQDNKLVAILDFDNCHNDYLCEDLSVPLLNHCTFTRRNRTKEFAGEFLASYSSKNSLSQFELDISLYSWLAFHAWLSYVTLLNELRKEASLQNEVKLLKTAKANLAKANAIQYIIDSGY